MQLGSAGSTTPSDLRGLTRYLTRTNSTKFSDTDVDALLNREYHEVYEHLVRRGGDVDLNMETETINLVADTQTHSVTGKVISLKRAEVTYDGTNWYKVTFFDINQRSSDLNEISDFSKTDPFGDVYVVDEVVKIDLYPIPSSSVTNGLKVWKVLEVTELSNATDEPVLPEAVQPALAYGAASVRFEKQGNFNKANAMLQKKNQLIALAIDHKENLNEDTPYVLGSVYDISYGD